MALFPARSAGFNSRLTALHLGNTRITDVSPLRLATQLTAVTFSGEPRGGGLLPVSRAIYEDSTVMLH